MHFFDRENFDIFEMQLKDNSTCYTGIYMLNIGEAESDHVKESY